MRMRKINFSFLCISRVITILFLLVCFFSSCKIKKIQYNKTRIIQFQEKGYVVKFDSLEIDIKNFYIEKEKILLINKNNHDKIIDIKSKGNCVLVSSEKLKNKTFNNLTIPDFGLLVINGLPVSSENLKKNILIDLNSIETIKVLSKESYQDQFPHLDLKEGILVLEIN